MITMRNSLFAFAALCSVHALAAVTMSKVAEYDFAVDGCGGIAYAGGNQFYVLRDHGANGYAELYPLTIGYNASSGAITSQTLGTAVQPGMLRDAEGIAYDPGSGALWISDETKPPTIGEFYSSGFQTGRNAPVPAIQNTYMRGNLSLEALTNATYTAVNKGTSLISFQSGNMSKMIVYEGICLGPRLSDGSLAVYLVSDGGATKSQWPVTAYTVSRLCALKLSGLDVVTVNYPTPSGGTVKPSGTNYRYLNGTAITSTLTHGATAPTAYTNNGTTVVSASWSAGSASGSGTQAVFSVTGDTTVNWTLTSSTAVTEIGSHDSFERFAVGTSAGNIAAWSGSGVVEALTYVPPVPPGYPMPRETHTKVLNTSGSSVRTLPDNISGNRHIDLMIEVRRSQVLLADATAPARIKLRVDSDGCFCLWHLKRVDDVWTADWTRVSDKVYADGDWVRVGLDLEDCNGVGFCRVKLDGSVCPTAAGVRSPANLIPCGTWYRIASGTVAEIAQLEFTGTRVDDLLITTDAFIAEHTGPTSTNGIDFAWFDEAGLPRDPSAAAPNLPGKTVQYIYDSGVAPYSDKPLSITHMAVDADGKVRMEFNAYKGDTPAAYYRVLHSTWSSTWEGDAASPILLKEFFKIEAVPTSD
ncbi:MAG: esterase-like activity of phytase family protein [Kiritimatiellae bacterium]|jgi:hypothetical protein|nr:esterase-like activity of phytase family protein [Kiritimatiellia bacterium]